MIRVLKVCEFFSRSIVHSCRMTVECCYSFPSRRTTALFTRGNGYRNLVFCDATSSTNDLKKLCNVLRKCEKLLRYPHIWKHWNAFGWRIFQLECFVSVYRWRMEAWESVDKECLIGNWWMKRLWIERERIMMIW